MRSGIAASAVHGREESRVLGAANQCQHQERRVQTEFDVAESRPRRRRRHGFAVTFGEALGREEHDGRELQRLQQDGEQEYVAAVRKSFRFREVVGKDVRSHL